MPDAPFRDVGGTPFEREINCIAWWSITGGGPEGRPQDEYGPTLDVRREQMASFLARLIDVTFQPLPDWDGANRFSDVPDDSPHVASINRLAAVGVVGGGVGGQSEDVFGPGEVVTRASMASFVARAVEFVFGGTLGATGDYFDDDTDATPHEPSINRLAEAGIVTGREPGIYDPFTAVRRETMAVYVSRALDLLVEMGWASPHADSAIFVDSDTVAAGRSLTGGETGLFGAAVRIVVSGCGLSYQDLALDQERRFTVPIPRDAPPGECELTFVLQFGDGSEHTESHGATVEPAGEALMSLDTDQVLSGEDVTGVETGVVGYADEITFEGCGHPEPEALALDEDRRFQVTVMDEGYGQCLLRFVLTYADGSTLDETHTLTFVHGDYSIFLDAETVERGGDLTGGETGFGGTAESVSGCGISAQELVLDDQRRFTITIPEDTPPGECSLTFVLADEDGSTWEEGHRILVTADS